MPFLIETNGYRSRPLAGKMLLTLVKLGAGFHIVKNASIGPKG